MGLSFLGRGISNWIERHQYWQVIGITLPVIFIFALLALTQRIRKGGNWNHGKELALLAAIFILTPLLLPRPDERFHFLIFGTFGFLCWKSFPPKTALAIGIGWAIGDEVLQTFLPERYGDLRDIAFNCLATLGGIYGAHIEHKA